VLHSPLKDTGRHREIAQLRHCFLFSFEEKAFAAGGKSAANARFVFAIPPQVLPN